jgi:hypothetical protein
MSNPKDRQTMLQRELRETLGAVIRRGAGFTVIAPQVLTIQQDRAKALASKFAAMPGIAVAGDVGSWFISYTPITVPESASLAWTKDFSGAVGSALIGTATLALVDTDASGHGRWHFNSANLANSQGATLEAQVRVRAGTTVAGSGFLLRIEDGTRRWDCYVRSGDIDCGGAVHSADMTTYRTVRLVSRTSDCAVYLDGTLVRRGTFAAVSANKRVTWGTGATDATQATVDVKLVRAALGLPV